MFFTYIFFQIFITYNYAKYFMYPFTHICISYIKYNVNDILRLSLIGLYTIYVYIVYTCVLCNHEDKFNRWASSCPFSVTPYSFLSSVFPFFFLYRRFTCIKYTVLIISMQTGVPRIY